MKRTISIVVLVLLAFARIAAKDVLSFDSSMDVYKRYDSLHVLYQKSSDKRLKERVVNYLLDSICSTHTYFLEDMIKNHMLEAPTPYQRKKILKILIDNKEYEEMLSFLDGTPYEPDVYILNNWDDSIRTVIRENYLEVSKNDFKREEDLYCRGIQRGSHLDCIKATRRKWMYERILLNMYDNMMIDTILGRMERNLLEQDSLIRETGCRNSYFESVYPNDDQFVFGNMEGFKYRKKEIYDKLFYLAIKYPMKYVFGSLYSTGLGNYTPFSYFVFKLFSETLKGFPDIKGLRKGVEYDSHKERLRAYDLYDEKKLEEVLNWCKLHHKDYKFK